MQTLWTRVAQIRGSRRCPQCASVAKRATSSTPGRSAPRYLTSSTLWYSGIFAVAATYDAGLKIRRREKWDKAIAEAKHELEQTGTLEEEAGHEVAQQLKEQQRHREVEWSSPNVPLFKDDYTVHGLEANVHSSKHRRRAPHWPANTGPELNIFRLPPQSIYAGAQFKDKHDVKRWARGKMLKAELASDMMLLHWFDELRWRGLFDEAILAVPASYADLVTLSQPQHDNQMRSKTSDFKRLSALNKDRSPEPRDALYRDFQRSKGDISLCRYEQDATGYYRDVVSELNNSIQDLFDLGQQRTITLPSMLAKISYNLSSSSAPPNVDTYNTLFVGLLQMREYDMVRPVLDAFRKSHIRPNEVSLASMLNYFTAQNDIKRFAYTVRQMRGKTYFMMMSAQPRIHISEAGKSRLFRNADTGQVVQLPYPTPMVFGALIKGVLKFSGFESALEICKGMSREGWGLCIGGLGPLLQNCAGRGDWTSGLAVWNQIQALKWRSRRRENGVWLEEKIDLPTFASMLALCSRCNKRDVFEKVMSQASRVHPQALVEIPKLVRAQREAGELDAAASMASVAAPADDDPVEDDDTAEEPFWEPSERDFKKPEWEWKREYSPRIVPNVSMLRLRLSGHDSSNEVSMKGQPNFNHQRAESDSRYEPLIRSSISDPVENNHPGPIPSDPADSCSATASSDMDHQAILGKAYPEVKYNVAPFQEQLHGRMLSLELGEYERSERPMSISG